MSELETEVLEVPAKEAGSQTKQKKQKVEAPIVSFDEESNFSSKSFPIVPKKESKFPERLSRVFLLADGKKQGNYTIMGVEDVIDPNTLQPRRARLLRGATSIWMDEQKQFESIKGYVEKNTLSIVFQKGRYEIQATNKLLNDFIDVSNRNLDNPNRQGIMKEYFKEWNTAAEAARLMKEEDLEFEAMKIAGQSNYEDIIPHAQYLGVDFIDPVSGHRKNEDGVRLDYMKKAKANPAKFLNSIHSPVVQMSYKVSLAIEKGKIDLGRQPDQAFWVDGGFICVIPQGRSAVEYLTEFSQLKNEASEQFVYLLNNVIK